MRRRLDHRAGLGVAAAATLVLLVALGRDELRGRVAPPAATSRVRAAATAGRAAPAEQPLRPALPAAEESRSAPEPRPEDAPIVSGTLVVRVRQVSNAPAAGASVEVLGAGSGPAQTDARGEARFTLSPGSYAVKVEHVDQDLFVERRLGVCVSPGAVREITVVLEPPHPVRVRVVDRLGRPIARASVTCVQHGNLIVKQSDLVFSLEADDEGVVTFEDPPPGDISFLGQSSELSSPAYRLDAGTRPEEIRLVLDDAPRLTVRLRDADGRLVDTVETDPPEAWLFTADPSYPALTGSLRHDLELAAFPGCSLLATSPIYVCDGTSDDARAIRYDLAVPLDLRAGEVREVTLQLGSATVTARLVGPDGTVPDLADMELVALDSARELPRFRAHVFSSDGRFRIPRLPAGRYRLDAGSGADRHERTIALAEGEQIDLGVLAAAPRRETGEGLVLGPGGEPLGGLHVVLRAVDGAVAHKALDLYSERIETGPDGRFRLPPDLATGRELTVELHPLSKLALARGWSVERVVEPPVSFVAGDPAPIVLRVAR